MKKILVIGGTGFIGFHIIKEAKKRNYSIHSVSLKKPKKKRLQNKVKYITADISKFNILKKKLDKNYDYVVNAGGYGIHPKHGKEGNKLIRSHYLGLINILKIINLRSIKKFVQLGSSLEYGKLKPPFKEVMNCKPKTPYAIAKYLCTNYLIQLFLKNKFPVTIFRLFQVFGPNQDDNRVIPYVISKCLKNKVFFTTAGKQKCDFCYIDDVVNIIFKSFKNKNSNGNIINVGSGKPIQLKKIFDQIVKIIGKGKPKIGKLKYENKKNKNNYPSIKRAKKTFNWSPKIKLNTGLLLTINSYR